MQNVNTVLEITRFVTIILRAFDQKMITKKVGHWQFNWNLKKDFVVSFQVTDPLLIDWATHGLLFRTERLDEDVERLGEPEVDGWQVEDDPTRVQLGLRVEVVHGFAGQSARDLKHIGTDQIKGHFKNTFKFKSLIDNRAN